MINNNMIHGKPITAFAEVYLAERGINFHLNGYHKAYLDIKQKGHDVEQHQSLIYILGATLLDIIVIEYDIYLARVKKSCHYKNKMYKSRSMLNMNNDDSNH